MSVYSLVNLPAKTAPAGLLASNAVGKPAYSDAEGISAPPARVLRDVSGTTGSTIRIGLPHMDVVLSLSAEPADGAAANADFTLPSAADGMPNDPVIDRLLHELGQPRGDNDDGVHADAIRLALVARWLRLRSQSNPETKQEPSNGALQKWRLKRVMAYIDEHIGEAISLSDLAKTAGLSRMYFAARFRVATGLRPHEYILRRRVEWAKDLLTRTDETLVEIALNVGFQTQAHFTTVFKRFAGSTPGRWRSSNRQFA
jgi:AraC family transcriptional regulator